MKLLLDIATYISSQKHTIVEAEVTTSLRDNMASDIFLVKQDDGRKIDKPRKFAEDIRDVILKSMGETEPDEEVAQPSDASTSGSSESGRAAEEAREEDGPGDEKEKVASPGRQAAPKGRSVTRGDGFKLTNADAAATEITMEVPDRVGLLADALRTLHRNNVDVVHAHIYTTPDGIASNYFSVIDHDTKGKVTDAALEEVRQALAARCHRKAVAAVSVVNRNALPFRSSSRKTDAAAPAAAAPQADRSEPPPSGDEPTPLPRGRDGDVASSMTASIRAVERELEHLDLNAQPPAVLSEQDRAEVDRFLTALPAYASLMFRSAKEEILGELREVRWAPDTTAFDVGSPIHNLYIIMDGALHRASYVADDGKPKQAAVLSRGCLLGEAAMAHAYVTPGEVRSVATDGEGRDTRAYAINSETFKRIVRARIHRARQICINVLNIVETFRMVPANSKELLLNALWSNSFAYVPGTTIIGNTDEACSRRALHIILEGEVQAVNADGSTAMSSRRLRTADSFGEDWLLSEERRARAAAKVPGIQREFERGYVAVTHVVTLTVTRSLLARLWGDGFDAYLLSRHDIGEKGATVSSSGKILGGKTSEGKKHRDDRPELFRKSGGRKSGGKSSLDILAAKPLPESPMARTGSPGMVGMTTSQSSMSFAQMGGGTAAASAGETLHTPTGKSSATAERSGFMSSFRSFSDKLKRIMSSGPSRSKPGLASPIATPDSSVKSRGSGGATQVGGYSKAQPETINTPSTPKPMNGGMRQAASVMDMASLSRAGSSTSSTPMNGNHFMYGGDSPNAASEKKALTDDVQRRKSDGMKGLGGARDSFTSGAGRVVNGVDRLEGYTFGKQLGVGLTGSVYKAWVKDPSSHHATAVAVKVMDKAKIIEINEANHVVQESFIMRSVSKHPFIISMLDSFQTPSAMFIVMDYAAGRDLFYMIHEQGSLGMFQTKAFLVQVILALDHVHAKGFIYRDLKPENLLVREDGYLCLTDFGFAKALKPGERAYTVCGTPDYLAPETLRQQGCNRAADFWAVGVLLFEMMTGYPPFHGQTHSDLYRRITTGRMRSFPQAMPEDARDLVQRLLRQSEGERIGVGVGGIQTIRRHAFYKGFSWTSVLERRMEMVRPKVEADQDAGPEDGAELPPLECLTEPCALSQKDQELFAKF